MATDLERLVVSLEASTKRFEAEMKKAAATTNTELRKVEARAKAMQKNVNSSFADLGKGLALGISVGGITAGIMAFKDLADAATRTQNSLKVAGLSGQELTDVYQQLFKAAQDNAAPIESLVSLYSRVAINQKELGVSSQRLVTFSANVAKALRVQGTTAEQAQGALLQLSQALAGGVVRAEEFNSIIEGAPTILQAAAAGLTRANGSVAELRKIMLAGQLSSKDFFEAFERGAPILDKKLVGSVLTVDQAFVKMRNSLQDSAGRIDSALGITAKAVEIIGRLSQAVDSLGQAFSLVAGTPTAEFIGKLNEIQGAVNPLYNALSGLESVINALPGLIRNSQLAAAEDDIIVIKDALTEMFDTIADAPDSWVSPKLKSDLAALKRQIDENAISAEEAKKRLADIANGSSVKGSESEGNSFVAQQTSRFNEFIDVIITTKEKVKELQDQLTETQLDNIEIGGNSPVPDSILQAQEDMKRSGFFNQRNAETMKNDLERNVETRANAIIEAATKIGVAMTEAQAKIQARTELQTEAAVKTFEGAISGYVDRVVSVESGGNPNAKNPDSTATGLGQFIESTWLDLFRRYYPAEAAKMSSSAILAMRTDATKSKALIEAYARENAAVLQKAGVSVDEAALQLSHFLGAADAAKVLSAAPGTPLKGLISSSSIAANPTILGGNRTVEDAIAYAQKRAGMTTSGTKAIDGQENFSEKLAEQQRLLEQLKEETGIRASLNPLIDDHGRKLTELEKAQELLNMAQAEGTAAGKELTSATQLLTGDLTGLTPEARAQAEAMRALAQQYGATTAAANQLKSSQEAAAKSSAESLELAKSVTGGILSDIRSALSDGKITWKEWGEIAVNALNKVADKLQEMLLNQLFSPTGAGGGFLSFLTGGGTSFNPLTATPGLWADGGYTGAGGKYDPAGIVHKGEYVFDQDSVKRLGLENLRALHGYANGGLVGSAPRLPDISRVGGAGGGPLVLDIRHYVDDDGNWTAKVSKISGAVAAKVGREGMNEYRRGQFHADIDSHMKRPRRVGSI